MIEIEELEKNGFIRQEKCNCSNCKCDCNDCKLYIDFIKDGITYMYSLKTKKLYKF